MRSQISEDFPQKIIISEPSMDTLLR